MSIEILAAWVAIILFVSGIARYLWHRWRWGEERELLRIYRQAAMLGDSGLIARLQRTYRKVRGKCSHGDAMRQSLIVVVNNKGFWREAVLKARVNRAEEKARFYQILAEQADGQQRKELKDVVDSIYDAVLDRLEAAQNQRWKDRANRWLSEIERERIEAQIDQTVDTSPMKLNEEQEPVLREGADPHQLATKQNELRELLEWALAHDTERALRVAYELSIFQDFHGQRNNALEALRKALDLVLERQQDAPKRLQIRVLDRAAHLANKQAYCDEAEKYAEKMLELSRAIKQDSTVATALQRLGRSHYFRCDSDLARELLEESLIQFQTLEPKDFKGVAWVQFDLGMLEVDMGNLTTARVWLEKSLDLHRQHGNGNEEGTVRVNLAFVLHKQGDWNAAHVHMVKAGELLKNDNYFRWYLHFLSRLDIAEGKFTTASTHLVESLKIFRDRDDHLGIIRSLLGFGWLAAKERQWERAVKLLGAEDGLREEISLPSPPDWKTEINFVVTGAREALREAAFDATWAEGKGMTWERAIEYALS